MFLLALAITAAAEPADNGLFSWIWRKSKKKQDKPIEFVSTVVTTPVVKSVTDSDTSKIASFLAQYGIDIARSEFDSFFATSRYADTASTNCLNYSMDYNEENCKYRYGILTMCQLQSRKNRRPCWPRHKRRQQRGCSGSRSEGKRGATSGCSRTRR